ncbi:hypothetical protein IWQ61_002471 [Dispira simplex]|nr:hypothetical protein IWQ61_002471 [Dispira simplex]
MKINILTLAPLILTAFLAATYAFDSKEVKKRYNTLMFSAFDLSGEGEISFEVLREHPGIGYKSAKMLRGTDKNRRPPQDLQKFVKMLDSPNGKKVIGKAIQDNNGNYSSTNLYVLLQPKASKEDIIEIEKLFGLVEGEPVKDSQFYVIMTSVDDSTRP